MMRPCSIARGVLTALTYVRLSIPCRVRHDMKRAADTRSLRQSEVDRCQPLRSDGRIYVREKCRPAAPSQRHAHRSRRAFRHGAGTPAEVAFDVPYQEFQLDVVSRASGHDVFSMARNAVRPLDTAAARTPCNLRRIGRSLCAGALRAELCASADDDSVGLGRRWRSGRLRARTAASRQVESYCGRLAVPRAGGYAGQHPERLPRLVLLRRPTTATCRRRLRPRPRPALGRQYSGVNTSRGRISNVNWDRQVAAAINMSERPAIGLAEMLASDPVGATWGPGYGAPPQTAVCGLAGGDGGKDDDSDADGFPGVHDSRSHRSGCRNVRRSRRAQKVFIDLACSSHNAMWEKSSAAVPRVARMLNSTTVTAPSRDRVKVGY